MRTHNTRQLNNAGFSLVELIVSVLISGFVMAMIVAFISISRRTYQSISSEATLATEAQMASYYINELLLEAQDCGSGNFSYTTADGTSATAKVIWIQAPDNRSADNDTVCDYFVVLETDTDTLRFGRFTKGAGTAEKMSSPTELKDICGRLISDPYALLAEHVSDIVLTPDVNNASTGSGTLTRLTLELEYAGKEYNTTLYAAARNMQ